MQKGVSPLIASVLLIAVTMAIAGVMATWATSFTATKISESSAGSDCIGAIDISSLQFAGMNVSVRIRNVAERINLTGIKASVIYQDSSLDREFSINAYGGADPLAPSVSTFAMYNTTLAAKPEKLEVRAGNCIKYPATLFFR